MEPGREIHFVHIVKARQSEGQPGLGARPAGREARQLTDSKSSKISEYQWSPDSKKLLLLMRESDDPEADNETPKAGAPPKPPKPIVLDRYHFKEDIEGYLSGTKRSHIYLFDIESKKVEQITSGDKYDETQRRPIARWREDRVREQS